MTSRLLVPVIVALCLLFTNCCYVAKQGYYTLKYSCSARSIAKVLKDTTLDPRQRAFLEQTLDIRTFAIEKIGLRKNHNYTNCVKIDKPYLVDVVSACQADRFSAYTWWFPLVGSVPYKGYFVRADALHEADRLRKKGYDVSVGRVDAFSTLGFFSDPVYSFMARLTPYELASLIIHEEFHATVFFKSNADFNEEAATFVGDEGALFYLRSRYGDTSAQYRQGLLEKADEATWERKLHELYDTLAKVYSADIARPNKLARKAELIDAFKKELTVNYSSLFKTDDYRGAGRANINNAYLLADMTYYRDLGAFYDLYQREGNNLPAVVAKLKSIKKPKKGASPAEILRTAP